MRKRVFIVALILVFLITVSALAQQSTATLKGTVKTEDGAVVQGVKVTAINTGTGLTWSSTSNDVGRYRLLTLPPGTYNLKLEKESYREKIYEGIVLSIGQGITFNVDMEPGDFESTITIQGEAPLIEITKSAVGNVIASDLIKAIPTKGRDYGDLAFLTPGVTENMNGSMGTGVSVNGQRGYSNTWILDGVSNDDAYVGGNIAFISQDTIEEFDVITHMAPAEYGQAAGGIINIATKSGGNDFHGSASLFWRDQSIMEKPHFADEEAPFSRLVFSTTLGGPLIGDKAFFFANYEGHDNDTNAVITAPREFGETVPNGSTLMTFLGKVDYQLNADNLMTFRANTHKWQQVNAGVGGWNLKETAYNANTLTMAFMGSLTTWLNEDMLSEARLSWAKKKYSGDGQIEGITEWHNLGNKGPILGVPYFENTTKLQFIYNFTYMTDNHTFKLGADIARMGTYGDATNWANGAWNFSGSSEFDPNDLSTYPYLYRQSINTTTEFDAPQNSYGVFAQDQWNIGDNLTINYGLRWDYEDFWSKMVGAGTVTGEPVKADKDNFQPRIGITWRPFEELNTTFRAGYGRYYDQVPTNEIVFIYLNTVNTTGFLFLWGDSEFGTIPIYPNRPNPDDYLVPGGDTGADFLDSELGLPHLDQFVLGVSHQFTQSTAIHMDFTYNEADGLWLLTNANPPDPVTGERPYDYDAAMYSQSAIGKSEYMGLMTRLEHRFERGLLNISYTLSSSKDNMPGDPNSSPVFDAFDPMANWGIGTNHAAHRFVASGYYVLPWDISLSGTFTYRSEPHYTAQTPDDANGDEIFWDIDPAHVRGDMSGDPFYNLDMRLSKAFRFVDRYSIEPFVEIYNVFNTLNYSRWWARTDYVDFGEPTGAHALREFQLGLRFEF